MLLERRNLLRGLVSLPLIGGGVTLIGRPAARVALVDVAAAPLLDDPHQRARYAWAAFSAAMREIHADAHGWQVSGGEYGRAKPWLTVQTSHKVPLFIDTDGTRHYRWPRPDSSWRSSSPSTP